MMFPCPTGFHVEFDLSRPSGHRVRSLGVLCTKCRVPHYEPVEDETVYKVVLPSYMVKGGDGFSMIRNETLKHNSGEMFVCCLRCFIDSWRFILIGSSRRDFLFYFLPGDLDISVLSNYIMQRKKIYPSVEGRIKIYNSASGLRGQTAPLVLLVSLGLLWTLCGSMYGWHPPETQEDRKGF